MSGRVGTIHSPSEKRYGRTLYTESRSMRCTIDPVGTARDDHRPGSSEITGQFCRDVFAVAAGCSRTDDRHARFAGEQFGTASHPERARSVGTEVFQSSRPRHVTGDHELCVDVGSAAQSSAHRKGVCARAPSSASLAECARRGAARTARCEQR